MLRWMIAASCLLFVTCAASAQDMPLSQVLIDGEGWQLVAEGYKFTEGPAVDTDGTVYFVDVPQSLILKVEADGKPVVWATETGKASGLMFGPEGRLYACQSATKKVVWYDRNAQRTVIADEIAGNDIMVDRKGGVYVTDMGNSQVWYVAPDGSKRVVASGFKPNGLTLWPDGGTLVVADWEQPHLRTFRVESDGTLKFGEKYYGPLQMPSGQSMPGSDGMTVDDLGRLYVATHAGLQMFDPTGRPCGSIVKPQAKFLSNVKFGGPNFDTVYVTSTDRIYKRKLKTTGTPHFLRTAKN
jgi:sugar lactone lactonase YvrE